MNPAEMLQAIRSMRSKPTGVMKPPKVKDGRKIVDGRLHYDGRGPSGYTGTASGLPLSGSLLRSREFDG